MEVAYLEAKVLQLHHLLKDRFLSLQQLANISASIVSHCPGTTPGRIFSQLSEVYQSSPYLLNTHCYQDPTSHHSRMLKPYHR